jgi:DNA polymerase III epsilon subunit-like protein
VLTSSLLESARLLVFFDLETSARSWKTCNIVQVAAVCGVLGDDGTIVRQEEEFTANVLLPQGATISKQASAVHGLTKKDLTRAKGAVSLREMLQHFVQFVGRAGSALESKNAALIAHNGAVFDFRILLRAFAVVAQQEKEKEKDNCPSWPKAWCLLVDSLALLKALCSRKNTVIQLPSARPNMGNVDVSKASGLKLGGLYAQLTGRTLRDAHSALPDTRALAELFQCILRACRAAIPSKALKKCLSTPSTLLKRMRVQKGVSDLELVAGDVDDSEDESDVLANLDKLMQMAEQEMEEEVVDDVDERQLRWSEVDAGVPRPSRGRQAPPRPRLSAINNPFVVEGHMSDVHRCRSVFGSPLSAFMHFFSKIENTIVAETNRYAEQQQALAEKEKSNYQSDDDDDERGEQRRKRIRKGKKNRKKSNKKGSTSSSSGSSEDREELMRKKKQRVIANEASHVKKWRNLDPLELREFLSCLLTLGALQRRGKVKEIFGEDVDEAVLSVSSVFTRDRMRAILSHLHFADNDQLVERGSPDFDPIGKVRPLLDTANVVFKGSFQPGAYVSVDECSKGFCGRAAHRKSMKHKPIRHRFGFNVFSAHCADTSFMYQFALQHSKLLDDCRQDAPPNMLTEPASENLHSLIPLFLVRGLIGAEIKPVLVCDRLYTSFRMASAAVKLGFNVLGTVRCNAAGLPSKGNLLKNNEKGKSKVFKFEAPSDSSRDLRRMNGMLAINYCDSKSFMLLSTVPSDTFDWHPKRPTISSSDVSLWRRRDGRRVEQKAPNLVVVYNNTMNGADRFDQAWSRYQIGFDRTRKWTVVIFYMAIDFMVENARIAFNFFAEKPLSPFKFRRALARSLLSRESISRAEVLQASFSSLTRSVRRYRDSPLPVRMSGGNQCTFGRVSKPSLTCAAQSCRSRVRGGCSIHKMPFCPQHYALHYSKHCVNDSNSRARSRTTSKTRLIPFHIE